LSLNIGQKKTNRVRILVKTIIGRVLFNYVLIRFRNRYHNFLHPGVHVISSHIFRDIHSHSVQGSWCSLCSHMF